MHPYKTCGLKHYIQKKYLLSYKHSSYILSDNKVKNCSFLVCIDDFQNEYRIALVCIIIIINNFSVFWIAIPHSRSKIHRIVTSEK